MSLAEEIYRELDAAGLAPSVPFKAAPLAWQDAIDNGIGDAEDLAVNLDRLSEENDVLSIDRRELRQQVGALESDLQAMTMKRDALVEQLKQFQPKEKVTA